MDEDPFFRRTIFDDLRQNADKFVEILSPQLAGYHAPLRITSTISDYRLRQAYEFWTNDLRRLMHFDLNESRRADHFKQAGYLAYWLRRSDPITEMNWPDVSDQFHAVTRARDIHLLYGAEYPSLMLGFDLCRYFEANRIGSSNYFSDYELDEDLVLTACHFMKTKSVSPHAVYMMYKFLFFNPLSKNTLGSSRP